jgi:uncharacterized protein YbaR (Trm112 family)
MSEKGDLNKIVEEWIEGKSQEEIEKVERYSYPIEKTIPVVVEEQLEEDSYSRDAIIAKPPVVVGEVHVAPEVVNTITTDADLVEKPIHTVQTTPDGNTTVIPTNSTPLNTKIKKAPLTSRPFIRSVSPSVQSKP